MVAPCIVEDVHRKVALYLSWQDRNFRALKQQLDVGAVGTMKVVKTCSRDNPLPPIEYLRTSGGIFHDMLIHDFDMLNFLTNGEETARATKMNDIDTCAVMFKYENGMLAMVDTSRDAAYGYDQRIEAWVPWSPPPKRSPPVLPIAGSIPGTVPVGRQPPKAKIAELWQQRLTEAARDTWLRVVRPKAVAATR
eukprot:s4054_g4.t1